MSQRMRERAAELAHKILSADSVEEDALRIEEFGLAIQAEASSAAYQVAAREVAYNMTAYLIDGGRYVHPEDVAHAIDMLTPASAQDWLARHDAEIRSATLNGVVKVLDDFEEMDIDRFTQKYGINDPVEIIRDRAALSVAAPGEETKRG